MSCWDSNGCKGEAERDAIKKIQHGLGPLKAIFAAGHTLCSSPAKGRSQCSRPYFSPNEPPRTAPATIRAVTDACILSGHGHVRCDLGSPGGGLPRVGLVVFRGVFRDLVEGGFNPGYYGVQHCAIDTAGAVVCCKDLVKCKNQVFERKKFPSPAVQLVGANSFVATRLENGDVYAWTSTPRIAFRLGALGEGHRAIGDPRDCGGRTCALRAPAGWSGRLHRWRVWQEASVPGAGASTLSSRARARELRTSCWHCTGR